MSVLPAVPLSSASSSPPPSGDGGDPPVAAIAAGLAAGCLPWKQRPAEVPERQYRLLLSTDRYDAWLISWPPGSGLEPHDHGGSIGAVAVVAGALQEEAIIDGLTVTRHVNAGSTVEFDADHVHAVANRGDTTASSVHVYSPPLRAMSYYRRTVEGTLEVDRITAVGPEVPGGGAS